MGLSPSFSEIGQIPSIQRGDCGSSRKQEIHFRSWYRPDPGASKTEPKSSDSGSAMSLGLRAGSEFVSAVILGLGIGWVLDRALHTNPAFLIVFFLIGVAAGIWNVIRLTSPKRSP